jgi:hypothetical protein
MGAWARARVASEERSRMGRVLLERFMAFWFLPRALRLSVDANLRGKLLKTAPGDWDGSRFEKGGGA